MSPMSAWEPSETAQKHLQTNKHSIHTRYNIEKNIASLRSRLSREEVLSLLDEEEEEDAVDEPFFPGSDDEVGPLEEDENEDELRLVINEQKIISISD